MSKNCPICNASISDEAKYCPICGYYSNDNTSVSTPNTSQASNYSNNDTQLCCPKCGSTQLHSAKKGFSGGKALAGVLLTGGVGLLAGTIGSGDIVVTCLACGHKTKAGNLMTRSQYKRLNSNKNFTNNSSTTGCMVFLVSLLTSLISLLTLIIFI